MSRHPGATAFPATTLNAPSRDAAPSGTGPAGAARVVLVGVDFGNGQHFDPALDELLQPDLLSLISLGEL